MENLFVYLYPLVSLVSLMAYLPQLKSLILSKSDCRDISVTSWAMWTATSSISLGYGMSHLNDTMFIITTIINLTCCAAVTGIVLYKRTLTALASKRANIGVAAE